MSDEISMRDYIADTYPEAMVLDDRFDECIVGIVSRFGLPDCVGYDMNKIIQVLQNEGLTYEEAEEYFDFNILGAYVGETTPVYIQSFE